MEKVQEISEVFFSMVGLLVDRPGDVVVNVLPTVAGPVLQLRVHSTDTGKVIGKQGRTSRALRSLLGAMSATAKLQLSLDIVEKSAKYVLCKLLIPCLIAQLMYSRFCGNLLTPLMGDGHTLIPA